MDAARGPFAAEDLAIIQFALTEGSMVGVETAILHKSGQWISGEMTVPAKQDAQGFGSAITYARRYSALAAAGLAPEDDDGDGAMQHAPPSPPIVEPPRFDVAVLAGRLKDRNLDPKDLALLVGHSVTRDNIVPTINDWLGNNPGKAVMDMLDIVQERKLAV